MAKGLKAFRQYKNTSKKLRMDYLEAINHHETSLIKKVLIGWNSHKSEALTEREVAYGEAGLIYDKKLSLKVFESIRIILM